MATPVLEVRTTLTTDEIEGQESWETIMIQDMPWQVVADLTGFEGVVLTSADGDVFIGDLEDWDEDSLYITLSLR